MINTTIHHTIQPGYLPPLMAEKVSDRIILPMMPETAAEALDMAVYIRFMRHLADVPNSRLEIKILHALQFTADVTGTDVAEVAMTLVNDGLRAPRLAFPAMFLEMADAALLRDCGAIGAANAALLDLRRHWDALGEDRWEAASRPYPLRQPRALLV